VLNELHASDEYLDMEFVEFLEFLVRISYWTTKHDEELKDE